MTPALQKQILSRAGLKSYGVIAAETGATRNQVAGVIFRAKHGNQIRKIGSGRKGPGLFAPERFHPSGRM